MTARKAPAPAPVANLAQSRKEQAALKQAQAEAKTRRAVSPVISGRSRHRAVGVCAEGDLINELAVHQIVQNRINAEPAAVRPG
jgi:hypothetical protein